MHPFFGTDYKKRITLSVEVAEELRQVRLKNRNQHTKPFTHHKEATVQKSLSSPSSRSPVHVKHELNQSPMREKIFDILLNRTPQSINVKNEVISDEEMTIKREI